jgi:hypothetical protein
MNADAPIIGGMNCPPEETDASTAPAKLGSYPSFFIRGMEMEPVTSTLAAALPLTDPISVLPRMAALAGPPDVRPNNLVVRSIKTWTTPDFIRNPANMRKTIMNVDITPIGVVKTPFRVKNCVSSI